MEFISPKLTLISQRQDGPDVISILSGSVLPYKEVVEELAPAGLYDLESERQLFFPLHKILQFGSGSYTFRTFGINLPPTSLVSSRFVYRPWWLREAWDAVTNTSLVWLRKPYPDNGSHCHCLLTWDRIAAYDKKNKEAYCNGDDWITVEAYENFIQNDIYHCREALK